MSVRRRPKRLVLTAATLLAAQLGCNTLYDTDSVVLEQPDADTTLDLADTPDASDTSDPDTGDLEPDSADLTDTGGDTSDTGDASDTPGPDTLDCTGQCGAGANCQACDGTCVDIATNAAHCGGCNADCTTLDNVASPSCVGGECRIPLNGCEPGWGNCDDNTTNGCEQDTTTDRNHCGECNNACELLPVPQTCVSGNCQ